MSSAGSPACASSQSRTPRRPFGSDQEVAHAVVAVHRHRAARSRGGGPPASARRARARGGPRPAHRGRAGGRPAGPPAAGPRWRPGRWCGWRPGRARPGRSGAARAAAHSASRRILRGMVSPSSRSTTNQLAPSSSRRPRATTAGHRDAGGRGRTQQGGLHPDPALRRALAAVHLQDERAHRAAVGLELERARDPRGATRQSAQAVHRAAERAAQPLRQLLVAQAGRHPYSTGTTGLPPSSSWCRYSQMP